MIPLRYALVIQYGAGYIYFEKMLNMSEHAAKLFVAERQARLDEARAVRGNRGAKPRAMLWELKQ